MGCIHYSRPVFRVSSDFPPPIMSTYLKTSLTSRNYPLRTTNIILMLRRRCQARCHLTGTTHLIRIFWWKNHSAWIITQEMTCFLNKMSPLEEIVNGKIFGKIERLRQSTELEKTAHEKHSTTRAKAISQNYQTRCNKARTYLSTSFIRSACNETPIKKVKNQRSLKCTAEN